MWKKFWSKLCLMNNMRTLKVTRALRGWKFSTPKRDRDSKRIRKNSQYDRDRESHRHITWNSGSESSFGHKNISCNMGAAFAHNLLQPQSIDHFDVSFDDVQSRYEPYLCVFSLALAEHVFTKIRRRLSSSWRNTIFWESLLREDRGGSGS